MAPERVAYVVAYLTHSQAESRANFEIPSKFAVMKVSVLIMHILELPGHMQNDSEITKNDTDNHATQMIAIPCKTRNTHLGARRLWKDIWAVST